MQLVAYGAQDIYLTGNPQITFFKVVYRRHTNFSMEAISQTLNGSTASGGSQTVTISRNGDLVSACYIQMKDSTFGMQEGEAYDLVDNVELEIGGQRIDKHYGDWNAIWWELTTPESKVNGLRNMLIENSGSVDGSTAQCYYPLNFWFCRNPGLALPLIALQYHEVKVKINWGTVPSTTSTADFYVDYIYLDTDERRRFAQQSHEYLIEQVQRQTNSGDSQKVKLNFNHPVKELVWVNAGSSNGYAAGCQFAPLRNAGASTNGTSYIPADNDDEINIKLTLNGHDRFSQREAKYFKSVQPYQHHTRVPAPTRKTVSGQLSELGIAEAGVSVIKMNRMARILDASLTVKVKADAVETITLTHGTVGNPDAVLASAITGTVADSISSAVGRPVTFSPGSTQSVSNGVLKSDFSVIVGPVINEAGDSTGQRYIGLDAGTGSTKIRGNLDVEVEELPTLIAGDAANTADIYCYSFALKPEEHQPSGTCNFSRIDSAYLEGDQNLGQSTSSIKVFAVNYNVLRIMSGMGGLAYSN
jgi:hypothetical protein